MKKGIILGILGAILGLAADYFTGKQTELMIEEKVDDVLKERGLIAPEQNDG